jgi:HD domain-containing protein
MGLAHLAKRFVTSLWPGGPTAADDAWATHYLNAGEPMLWRRMPGFDRRHAVGVARRVCAALDADATRPVVAAALLHDVGKIESGFGVWRRVLATVWTGVRGRSRVRGRTAVYVNHPSLGAQLLRDAGADPLTASWAEEHHLPASQWTVPEEIAAALKASDDD